MWLTFCHSAFAPLWPAEDYGAPRTDHHSLGMTKDGADLVATYSVVKDEIKY